MKNMMIKVCGLTCQEDLEFCQEMGIDLTGFIFHPSSPRCVDPELAGGLKKKNELRVGVFVRQTPAEILDITDVAGLDLVQLHGDQDRDFCAQVGPERVMRAFWPERYSGPEELQAELEFFSHVCRFFLLDAGKNTGGHGRSITSPWLDQIRSPRPCFLAGGLGPENIEKMYFPGISGVDLNSGVEAGPGGRKDKEKIKRVLKICRSMT
ncbi:MAG: phosphoribosylanthranilate isomerase [Desulfonatronovibrionaceae bacterium]